MSMEWNKILAAVLLAGIIAYFSGFASNIIMHGEKKVEGGYAIEAVETAAAPGAAEPTGPEPIADLMASADPAAGEKVAKVCAACHTFDKGGANRVGPNLFGVVGAKHANHEGFAYSEALKATPGKWDVESLNAFLWSPKKYAPGTKMTFAGIKKPEDRAAVIKWLETHK